MEAVIGDTAIETRVGAVPLPLNGTVWLEPGDFSSTLRVPARKPSAVGVNVMETLQLAPARSVFGAMGQVETSEKSPDTEMLLTVSATVCLLLSVMILAVLVVCITQFPNVALVGVKV